MTGTGEHLFELNHWLMIPPSRTQLVALRSIAIWHGLPLEPNCDYLDCLAAGLGTLKTWKEEE